MSFPSGTPVVTLTGTVPSAAGGSGFTGRIVLTPSAVLTDAAHKAVYPGGGPVDIVNGTFSVQVIPNDAPGILPAGWKWQIDLQPAGGQRVTFYTDIPTAAGPTVDLSTLVPTSAPDGTGQSLPPSGPAGGALTGSYPNPQLSTATIASFDAAGSAAAAQTVAIAAAAIDATNKVTAHTNATDPHGDRAYADSSKLAKTANLSDLGSINTARTNLGLGGAALLNVGTTAGTVAAGNDSRLSDARTPTTHAATHAAAGTDPVTLTQAQITGLPAALAALLPLTGGTLIGDVTVNGANLTIKRADNTGAYRLRTTGSALDLEIAGADVIISKWTNADFTGTQSNVMRWEAAGPHLIGRTQFGTGAFDDVHDIDAGTGVASLGAKNSLANTRFCGRLTTTGAPTTLTWSAGDTVQDANGAWWLCTTPGTPGTWIGTVSTAGSTITGDLTVTGRLSGPIAPYGVIAPSRTSPTWRKASTSFTFQSGHGWTAVGAASSNLNNSANNPVRGTQYASITTDTAGSSANLRKFAMSAMDLTDKAIRLICRIDDITKIATLNFFAGTSSLANNFKWTLWETAGTSQLGSSGEWITLTFGWSSLNNAAGSYTISSTGVPSTTTGFTDLEVQAIATSGNAITLDVQAVEIIDATSTTFPNGVVSIVFDDGADSIWNYARPAMDAYGFQGTNYVIVSNLGTASYMTTSQSQQLQNFSGWEIGFHSYDATMHNNRYTTYTAAQVDDDIRKGKQWLVSNGFRGESIAYPGGEYQTTTDGVGIDSIASRYFSTGRTILFQTGYPTETFPAGMPMRMRAVSSISSTQVGGNNPANLVAAGGLLDKCQLNGGWLVLVFHKIVTGTATVSTECSQSDFQLIMAGINSRGIPVVPVSDVMRLYN